jgi:hypothetical protein
MLIIWGEAILFYSISVCRSEIRYFLSEIPLSDYQGGTLQDVYHTDIHKSMIIIHFEHTFLLSRYGTNDDGAMIHILHVATYVI